MLGQDDPGVYVERMAVPHIPHDGAQQIDFADQQMVAVPLQQVHGKKPSSAWDERAPIVGHILVFREVFVRPITLR